MYKNFIISEIVHIFAMCLSNTIILMQHSKTFQIMAKKANDIINVRVLEQDTCDQIRIGCSTPIFKSDIKNVVEALRKQYDKKLAWCGGFKAKGEEYYERIALVNADTLQSVAEVWKKGELW